MASRPHLENQELIITHTFLNSQVNQFQPDFQQNDPMLMQDNMANKGVNWTDDKQDRKLINDDSAKDLIYQENPLPVMTHKQEYNSKGIMKVTSDPFYAECFPPTDEQDSIGSTLPNPQKPEIEQTNQTMANEESKADEPQAPNDDDEDHEGSPAAEFEIDEPNRVKVNVDQFQAPSTGESSEEIMIKASIVDAHRAKEERKLEEKQEADLDKQRLETVPVQDDKPLIDVEEPVENVKVEESSGAAKKQNEEPTPYHPPKTLPGKVRKTKPGSAPNKSATYTSHYSPGAEKKTQSKFLKQNKGL